MNCILSCHQVTGQLPTNQNHQLVLTVISDTQCCILTDITRTCREKVVEDNECL